MRRTSYLFKTSMMSSSVVCSDGAVPFAGFAGATGDAPLARGGPVSVRFRFARDGDAGADGGDDGVRVPLVVVAAMVKATAFRDRRWVQACNARRMTQSRWEDGPQGGYRQRSQVPGGGECTRAAVSSRPCTRRRAGAGVRRANGLSWGG